MTTANRVGRRARCTAMLYVAVSRRTKHSTCEMSVDVRCQRDEHAGDEDDLHRADCDGAAVQWSDGR